MTKDQKMDYAKRVFKNAAYCIKYSHKFLVELLIPFCMSSSYTEINELQRKGIVSVT